MRSGRRNYIFKAMTAAMALLLVFALLPVSADAAGDEGLVVERLTFRDVLRLYTMDKAAFGADALAQDDSGVTNAAKYLAEMFAYTVGLNYEGYGLSVNYFGKDITAKMGQAPYAGDNLLATFDVEILPYRSYALALPQGQTTAIRVYLAGYSNAASGVEPVLHYVWQDSGIWYAVKDDNPYYKVSYNGMSARQAQSSGYVLTHSRAVSGGTEQLQGWTSLAATPDGDGIVHLNGGTLVAGEGTVNMFGVTRDLNRLQSEGGYSSSLLAVSDFVRGDTTYQTGPLVYAREVYEAGTTHRVTDGEALREGVSYRFRVVYDEALAVPSGVSWSEVGMRVRSEVTGESKNVSDFVWYGAEKYLTGNEYNPRTVEFTFTPSTEGQGLVTFTPVNLVGSASTLKAAASHARTNAGAAPAAAVPAAAPAAAAEPAAPAAVSVTPDVTPTAEPAAPVETPVPTATPIPVPATPQTTLAVFNEGDTVPLTRGVLAQTLWALAGQPAAESEAIYADQPEDSSYSQAVLWAGVNGLMRGNNGVFGVDESVTREQAAVILYRYAALRGRDTTATGDLSAWSDGAAVSDDARTAVVWALEHGLMSGRDDGGLHLQDTVLCGDAISMIATLQQNL